MTDKTDHGDLRWGHLTAEMVQQWAELTNLLAEVDGTEEFYEVEDLAEELEETGFTPETDSWAVWDADRLVAYAQLRVSGNLTHDGEARCNLGGGVHPQWRGRGIGRELVRRQEERGRVLAAERHAGAPVIFRASGELDGSDARGLLTHLGYAVVRFFNELVRPLPGEALTEPELDGVTLVTPAHEHEEAVRVAHNTAFADHWGSSPSSPEGWHDYWTARSARKRFSTLALGPDGEVLAYVLSSQWTPRELYVASVGTLPHARGRGLAAACLARCLRIAGESGEFDSVELGVDSMSPTGATRLYERLGFTVARTIAMMQKDG